MKENPFIAHRGIFDNEKIPENSLLAFQKAIKQKLPIEFDVQLTKDNVLVVFHDLNMKRMTGINQEIQNMSYEEIQKCFLRNTKEKIPTLKEVLDMTKDKVFLNIEIKNTKRIQETCDQLIKDLSSYHNFVIQSFHPKIVRYMKKKCPNFQVGYLIHKKYPQKGYNFFLQNKWMISYSKADFLSLHKDLLQRKKFQKLSKKYPTFIWTITKQEEIKDENFTYICNFPI